jgi:hypothetical protein
VIRLLSIGEVIDDRFEVLERIGGGGASAVYRGLDRQTGDQVAVKVLTDTRDDFRQRFEREVGILAHLSHPVIVRYVAHGELSPESPYLITEWMEGETLSARLRAPGLTMAESVELAQDLSSALAVIHQHDLVHRDVKPANVVFIEPGGRACRLIDFGIARSTLSPRAITSTGIMVGTPGFVSPEQARGSLSVGPPSDVFSLGCLLYMCLTGVAPFGSPSVALTFMKIMTEAPPRLRALVPEAPVELEDLVAEMLAKDARKRPETGTEVLVRLSQLGDLPATEPRPSGRAAIVGRRSSEPTSRHPADDRTVAYQASAVLVLGGGAEPLDAASLRRLGELARSVNARDVLALPDEVLVVRGTHTQLRPLVEQLAGLAFACLRDLGDRVITIAEDHEAEWAVETAQQESLARLFEESDSEVEGGPVVLIHERLRDLVGQAHVAETRGGRVLLRLRPATE